MTTIIGIAAADDDFEKRLSQCMDDLTKLMPHLSRRYSGSVIVSAMAEHMGGALQGLLHNRRCSVQQVARLIGHVEAWAFHDPNVSGPQPDSTH
jgi:hypothetical protein